MPYRRAVLASLLVVCLAFVGCPPKSVTVPNLANMTEADAATALAAATLTLGTVTYSTHATIAAGHIISQNPLSGASASQNSSVAVVISSGPPPTLGWNYTLPDTTVWGLAMDQTSDDGFFVGGGHSNDDMYVLKLTSAGAFGWEATYSSATPGGAAIWDHELRGVRQTGDGGYVLAGGGYSANGYLLVKTNSSGAVSWSNTYTPLDSTRPGFSCFSSYPTALVACNDGGYFIAGYSLAYVGGNQASVVRTNSSGTVTYCKLVDVQSYHQYVMDAQQTSDNGFVLTGYSDNGPHGYQAFIIKLDSNGDFVWRNTFQYPTDGYGAAAYAVIQTSDGGYLLGGELINNITKPQGHHCWITKLNSSGSQVWAKRYNLTPTISYANCLLETPDGDFLATGHKDGDMTLAKFDAAGDLLWNFQMDTLISVIGRDAFLTADGGCVVLGSGSTSGGSVVAKVNNVYVP